MNILLAPDSFKGTLSAREVCEIEARAICDVLPDAHVTMLPMADGGEGMADACLSVFGGERTVCRVTGPDKKPVDAAYALLSDGSAALEMAAAAGLPLLHGNLDPLHATTYGVGELLRNAQSRGAKRILLGLGGSATNDCGVGMAAALGWRFWDADGVQVAPLAENLGKIAAIVPPEERWEAEVLAACDVDNPLLGECGATYVFGPQKGVTEALRPRLEAGMVHFAAVLKGTFPDFDAFAPGAGAAGGMGAAVMTFLGGTLRPGIELMLDAAKFDALAADADLVITGEGRMDAQSLRGKVPCGVAKRAQRMGKPCVAVCGALGDGAQALTAVGVTAFYAASHGKRTMDALQKTCRSELYEITKKAISEQLGK